MIPSDEQRRMGEGVDRLVTVEITGRGVIGDLYAAARARHDGPLCLEAAGRLLDRVHKGDVVMLATGFPTHPWFTAEQDGPVGTATLARALVLGIGARPVIVTDPAGIEVCAAALRGAGLHVRSVDDALALPTTAAVVAFPLAWNEAQDAAGKMLGTLRPAALVAVERPGANDQRQYHAAGGQSITEHCAKIDVLFDAARARGLLTIGIADGGNEIGSGAIRDAILNIVPHARKCACPCGGSIVPTVPTDLLVTAAISNWGAYAVEAAMALLLGRPEVMHPREVDARTHELCAAAGANNDGPGLLDVGADALPAPLHGHVVDLLGTIVRNGLDFGRLYRDPRYPWL